MLGRSRVELKRRDALRAAAALAVVFGLAVGARALTPPEDAVVPLAQGGLTEGGWSGIDVSADGTRFWAVADDGRMARGRLVRSGPEAALAGLETEAVHDLRGLRGAREMREPDDSEGIDVRPGDGQIHLSFEGWARLRRFDAVDGGAHWVPDAPGFATLPDNAGFEALARDRFGRLYTLPEIATPGGAFPLWRFTRRFLPRAAHWDRAAWLAAEGRWRATGADFGPDGRLYLLERRFDGIGFSARIRAFDVAGATPDDTLPGTLVYHAPTGRHGNLEGLGIWADGQGRLRAVMVSDDNHSALLRGQLIETVLPVRLARGDGAS